MTRKIYFSLFHFFPICVIGSLLGVFICINKHSYTDVAYYYIPLAFFICMVAFRFYGPYANQLSIRIIEVLMVVRYVITPISYYYRTKEPLSFDLSYATLGLFYMIYEMIVVFFMLNFFASKIFIARNRLQRRIDLSFSDIGVRILLVLFVLTLVMYPQYLHNLLSFSFETLEEVEVESDVNGMFNLIYKSGSIIVSCLLLSRFKKNKGTISSLTYCLIICWICTWVCSLGTSGLVSRTSFLTNGIIFTMMVLKYYPQYKKKVILLSTGVVLSMLIFGTISRFYNNRDSSTFWVDMLDFEMLDSYFGGLRNVMVSLKMEDVYGEYLGFKTFLNDMFAGVPFFASRSGMDFDMRSSFFFNVTFFGTTGILSRIIPIIGQGYAYFGPILSPLPTAFCVWCALKLNRKMNESGDAVSFYMYCLMMYFFCAYSMYNMNTIAGGFWNKVFPILLVVMLNNLQKKLHR